MAHRTLEIAEEEIDKISKLDEHFEDNLNIKSSLSTYSH